MAKRDEDTRTFGEIMADIRTLQERFGHVAHFLRMAGFLFDAVRADDPDVKRIAAKVEESYRQAMAAVDPTAA
jgi:hypothetical protein